MSADHRKRGFWGAVFDDRYRKLVAVGLAVLLWWFINGRITDSWTLPMLLVPSDRKELQKTDLISNQLSVLLPSGGRVRVKSFFNRDTEIDHVKVTFSGPRDDIDALREGALVQLEVVKLLDRVWKTGGVAGGNSPEVDIATVEFTAEDIRRAFRRDDVTIELSPPRVRVVVEIRESISVLLTKKNVRFNTGGNKRLRLDQINWQPRRMEIVGPAIAMRNLDTDNQFVFQADFNVQATDTQVSAELKIIGGPKNGIYPVGTVATVTILLEPERKHYTLTLPLRINDKRTNPTTSYEIEEKSLDVDLSFAGALAVTAQQEKPDLQGWAARNFRLEVNITSDAEGEELNLQPFLIPDGAIFTDDKYKHSDYKLHASRTVTVRKKK